MSESASRGRQHPEPRIEDLPLFELDRRRVLQSSAFRRLQYKTQVFIAPEEDHFRTRLTHTLEVASQARQLAVGLGLDVTLAEVVALAHDLGHPPFGHAGERALNAAMADHGGYEHNAQSLRVVEYLEHPFPPFRGLNLSFEVREGLARHHTAYDHPAVVHSADPALAAQLREPGQPSLEAQVVALADGLAYDAHDLEDALGAGLIELGDLQSIDLWARAEAEAAERLPAAAGAVARPGVFAIWRPVIDMMQWRLREDAAAETARRLQQENVLNVEDVRAAEHSIVDFSAQARRDIRALEAFLRERVYGHGRVREADAAVVGQVRDVFQAYIERPERLPPRYRERIDEQGLPRVVCDYVAGMTDRFCAGAWSELCG